MNQKIFILGFMGVGKTTIGRKLAKKIDYQFYDLDKVIEEKHGITINDFFEKFGEEQFRAEETAEVKKIIAQSEKAIISVGGGMPCFNDNMDLMNHTGTTIYLQRPVKELFQRLKKGKSKRPLIKDLDDEELLSYIENKIKKREPFYKQAKLTLNRNQQEIESIITELSNLSL